MVDEGHALVQQHQGVPVDPDSHPMGPHPNPSLQRSRNTVAPLEIKDCGKEVSVVWVIDSDAERECVGGRRGAQPPQPLHVHHWRHVERLWHSISTWRERKRDSLSPWSVGYLCNAIAKLCGGTYMQRLVETIVHADRVLVVPSTRRECEEPNLSIRARDPSGSISSKVVALSVEPQRRVLQIEHHIPHIVLELMLDRLLADMYHIAPVIRATFVRNQCLISTK
mmetsp:Transcript_41469/g.69331  ORF Transcript_41469/g.69331 Transcript_41469/m.69331 type:complete len:224 (+) Transcript_41469:3-674(+)